jgi:LacI family transcriptional regulator
MRAGSQDMIARPIHGRHFRDKTVRFVPNPSVRSLARQLGLSPATVSLALRDSPRVVPATKERVRRAASRAGYRSNPLVNSVLTGVRRSAHGSFQGTLMALNYSPAATPTLVPFHREVLVGAKRRASELGFSLSLCWVGPRILTIERLNAILAARGVQGVVVMPFAETLDFSALAWHSIAAVVMDHCLSAPALTTVLPDHHLSIIHALERLAELGYRRPGLVLDASRDTRLHYRWSAGYCSFSSRLGRGEIVPVLIEPQVTREAFVAWFEAHRPDVIIGHRQVEIIGWLQECDRRVPADVGFVQLNWTERTGPCAALDQQPAVLGAAAVDAVVAQLHRNERGLPEYPMTIMMPARWIDGPTIKATRSRRQNAAEAPTAAARRRQGT